MAAYAGVVKSPVRSTVSSVVSGTVAGGGAVVSPYLDGVIDSTVADLDATLSDSYTSGQTWANLIASPADGAAQTDYDFYLGVNDTATTDDPTFTGSAGDSGAYFNHDGGDFFSAVDYTKSLVLLNGHRTDVSGSWVALTWRQGATLPNWNFLVGTGTWNSNDIGFSIPVRSSGAIEFRHVGDSGLTSVTIESAGSIAINTDYILVLSWDGTSTTNNIRSWLSSTTRNDTSISFSTQTGGSTESAAMIGASPNEGSPTGVIASGSRIYSFAAGNELLDDAKAAAIIGHLETRHGRDYTP